MNPSAKPGHPYQPFRTKRPVRHDVLIIIDGTGSMAGEIDNLRTSFGEVIDKYAEGLDLRLDVWSLGDYTTHAGMPIIPLGARMRHKTFRDIAKEIKADRGQTKSEAEAYEVALQYAYLGHHVSQPTAWQPRTDAHRTIILVGDSYPHGWIARKNNEWGQVIYQAFICPEAERDAALGEKINTFQRRHPQEGSRDVRRKEENAHKAAHQNRATLDPGYGDKGHVNVPGVVFDKRPNVRRGLERCVERRKATIHTIASGTNLVNHAFMKFAAMMGNGTYTHIRGGELKHALAGIFTSRSDKFHELKNDVESQGQPHKSTTSPHSSTIQRYIRMILRSLDWIEIQPRITQSMPSIQASLLKDVAQSGSQLKSESSSLPVMETSAFLCLAHGAGRLWLNEGSGMPLSRSQWFMS